MLIIFLIFYLVPLFLCIGVLFGNFSALAIEPLGHIAGVANSVISSSQTLISTSLGALVGFAYNGTVLPLSFGFLIFSLFSLLIVSRVSSLK